MLPEDFAQYVCTLLSLYHSNKNRHKIFSFLRYYNFFIYWIGYIGVQVKVINKHLETYAKDKQKVAHLLVWLTLPYISYLR